MRGLGFGFNWLRRPKSQGGVTYWNPDTYFGADMRAEIDMSDTTTWTTVGSGIDSLTSVDGLSTWVQSNSSLRPEVGYVFLNGYTGARFIGDTLQGTGQVCDTLNGVGAGTVFLIQQMQGDLEVGSTVRYFVDIQVNGSTNSRYSAGMQNTANPQPLQHYSGRRRLDADANQSGVLGGAAWVNNELSMYTFVPKPSNRTVRNRILRDGAVLNDVTTAATIFLSSGNFSATNSNRVDLGVNAKHTLFAGRFFNRELTTLEIQKLEGWYAWLHPRFACAALRNLLDAGHPYKLSPPLP
jgi:hypothetical protein